MKNVSSQSYRSDVELYIKSRENVLCYEPCLKKIGKFRYELSVTTFTVDFQYQISQISVM